MLLNYLALAVSVSIDSLGIGITYGFRKTCISNISKIILFVISIIITYIGIIIGKTLSLILPSYITVFLGAFILIIMGSIIIFNCFKKDNTTKAKKIRSKKIYNFFIKSLGITIKIIKDPISSDLDNSKKIDAKEALYLGLALSLDSLCVGVGGSIIGFNSIIFPIMVAIFQLLFLSFGRVIGTRIVHTLNIPQNIYSIISGIILICIGFSRLF